MSPTQPLAEAQESMTPDQRLDLLLAAAEQQVRENEAAAARARIFGTDHLGQQEHNALLNATPTGWLQQMLLLNATPTGLRVLHQHHKFMVNMLLCHLIR